MNRSKQISGLIRRLLNDGQIERGKQIFAPINPGITQTMMGFFITLFHNDIMSFD